MKIPFYINGLLPITRDARQPGGDDGGSRVFVKIQKDGLKTIEKITTADKNGVVEFNIDDKYVGATALIYIRHRWYKNIESEATIPDYGLFYTAKINHDFNYWSESLSTDPEWETEAEYVRASAAKDSRVRQQRFRNKGIRSIYYLILIAAPLAGLIIQGILGVVFGLAIAALLELLSPYSIGLKRFYSKKVTAFLDP